MKIGIKLSLCDQSGERFFGRGVYQLLVGIRRLGSLRSAAMEMGMAYTKATRILKNAEEHFGYPLTTRKSGGAGGGGSVLTPEAEDLLVRYESLMGECDAFAREMYQKYFAQEKNAQKF